MSTITRTCLYIKCINELLQYTIQNASHTTTEVSTPTGARFGPSTALKQEHRHNDMMSLLIHRHGASLFKFQVVATGSTHDSK